MIDERLARIRNIPIRSQTTKNKCCCDTCSTLCKSTALEITLSSSDLQMLQLKLSNASAASASNPGDKCQFERLTGLSRCAFSAGCTVSSSNICSATCILGCAGSISPGLERSSSLEGGVSGSGWRCFDIALSVRRATASDATPIQVPAMPKKMAWILELGSSSGLAMPPVG